MAILETIDKYIATVVNWLMDFLLEWFSISRNHVMLGICLAMTATAAIEGLWVCTLLCSIRSLLIALGILKDGINCHPITRVTTLILSLVLALYLLGIFLYLHLHFSMFLRLAIFDVGFISYIWDGSDQQGKKGRKRKIAVDKLREMFGSWVTELPITGVPA